MLTPTRLLPIDVDVHGHELEREAELIVIGVLLLAAILLAPMVLIVWMAVFWLRMLVEVVSTPDLHFRAAGSEKITWVLLVVFLGWLGALIYKLKMRSRVHWYALGR